MSLASLGSIICPFISPEPSDLSSESESASDSEQQHDSDDAADFVSHLSTGDHPVDEKTFRSTLQYIFTFIKKVHLLSCLSWYPIALLSPISGKTSKEHC